MIVDDPDNSVERFAYSKRGWSDIKTVVRDVLNRDADQIVLESARMDGTKHDVTLRRDLGPRPTWRHLLIRDNQSGEFSPHNCRWRVARWYRRRRSSTRSR